MVASVFLLAIATSCTKDDPDNGNNTSDNGSGWNTSFPEKKVKSVKYDMAGFPFTYEFYWNGDRLNRISCSTQYGVINSMYFNYDGQGRISKTAFQMDDDEVVDAYTYTYDANGRLIKQEIQVPCYEEYNPATDEYVTVYKPSTYTFTYTNENVSKIHHEYYYYKYYGDGGLQKEEVDYLCTWTDGNLTLIRKKYDDGDDESYTLQYDNKKNPLRFPMGVEVIIPLLLDDIEDTDVVDGDYSYMMALFYAFGGAGVNNWTSFSIEDTPYLIKTYTYDSDGYPQSGTYSGSFGEESQPITFTFTY